MNLRTWGLWLLALLFPLAISANAQTPAAPRRIALVSDPHVSMDPKHADYNLNFQRVIDDVNAADVDAVLIAGDLTQSGDVASMEHFAKMAKGFRAPARWVPGNHDIGNKAMPDRKGTVSTERVARYEKALGAPSFVVELVPGIRVIAIASPLLGSDLPAEAGQWELLEKELGRKDAKSQTVLLTHYPPFVAQADEPDDYFNLSTKPRQRLLGLIEKGGVAAILSGHLHRPISVTASGVPVIGAPAVSFGLPRGKQGVGWALVAVDAGSIKAENRYLSERVPTTSPSATAANDSESSPSDRVQIFYYNWYGAPPFQKQFVHWQQGGRTPPDDIGSNYFPKLGPYSSGDKAVLKQHMTWIKEAGVGTLCLTWWGRESFEETLTADVLDAAAAAGLKVNFHLEPYAGHTPKKLADDVRYLLERYGKHPAFYRAASHGNKPIFYIFETVRHPAAEWKRAVDALRADAAEPVLLIAQTSNLKLILDGGFDGGYPYDGLAPFKLPAFLRSWETTAKEFEAAGKLFIPSVGPGYWDDRAVPNGADEPEAARSRDSGKAATYDSAWRAAIAIKPPFVTITSFNEWHEGSQIEPAVEKTIRGYRYPAYAEGEDQYLRRTALWAKRYVESIHTTTAPMKQP